MSPWLKYFVLEWLQRGHREPWRSPGGPCHGVLRLPVHKFGILGYPYFSTPTGAPGPGPHTVPSAVGPGPKQGTGTHGLGHVAPCSAPTTPSRTARVDCGVVGEVVGASLTQRGETSAPIPPYKQGSRGSSPICPLLFLPRE